MFEMATTLFKSGAGIIRRTVLITAARASSHGTGTSGPPDHHKGKIASDKVTMPDAIGHAVGAERFELLAKLAGNEDPFEMSVKTRAKGTFEEPTIIPSMFDKRLVGCICEEDAISINWMYLHTGEPKRCECGYWFKLEPLETIDYSS